MEEEEEDGGEEEVSWCFTPSQPVRLYQGDTHLILYIYFLIMCICLKMGLYTVLKPSLKDENTNITKTISNLNFSLNQKVKNLFR